MKYTLILAALFLLTACPTPPDEIPPVNTPKDTITGKDTILIGKYHSGGISLLSYLVRDLSNDSIIDMPTSWVEATTSGNSVDYDSIARHYVSCIDGIYTGIKNLKNGGGFKSHDLYSTYSPIFLNGYCYAVNIEDKTLIRFEPQIEDSVKVMARGIKTSGNNTHIAHYEAGRMLVMTTTGLQNVNLTNGEIYDISLPAGNYFGLRSTQSGMLSVVCKPNGGAYSWYLVDISTVGPTGLVHEIANLGITTTDDGSTAKISWNYSNSRKKFYFALNNYKDGAHGLEAKTYLSEVNTVTKAVKVTKHFAGIDGLVTPN